MGDKWVVLVPRARVAVQFFPRCTLCIVEGQPVDVDVGPVYARIAGQGSEPSPDPELPGCPENASKHPVSALRFISLRAQFMPHPSVKIERPHVVVIAVGAGSIGQDKDIERFDHTKHAVRPRSRLGAALLDAVQIRPAVVRKEIYPSVVHLVSRGGFSAKQDQ